MPNARRESTPSNFKLRHYLNLHAGLTTVNLVSPAGLEPATSRFEAWRSIR